jgi:hypothetical protein
MSFAKVYKGFLTLLSELPIRQIKVLSSYFTRGQILALREVFTNLLAGHLSLTPKQKKLLAPHRKFIRNFAKKSIQRCKLNKHCRPLLYALKAAKNTIEQL